MLFHQGLVVKGSVHGVVYRKEVNPAGDGHLVQDGGGKAVDKGITGQVRQAFLRQFLVQNLRCDKNIRDVVSPHLGPAVASLIGPGIGEEPQFNVRALFAQQL